MFCIISAYFMKVKRFWKIFIAFSLIYVIMTSSIGYEVIKMTLGERIRFCRKSSGLTQDQLAEITGIHTVSINKYEKDKMVPKPDQLSKIAVALNVSTMTLNGSEDPSFKVETIGDFMGFLFTMHHAGIMMLKGKRDKDGYIKEDTAYIEINPAIRQYFGVKGADNPNDLTVVLKNKQVLKDMIRWEQTENYLISNKEKYDELSQKEKEVFDGIKADKEEIELRLSMSNVMLDTSAGLSVRINNNYSV